MQAMEFRFIHSINDVPEADWDALWSSDYPFSKHAWFAALENSGSTNAKSGWQPLHCLGYQSDSLCFAMPLFLKTHSYGEYVFDWAWADAYHRSGIDYYPKLLNAIPFTPATGPRWAAANELQDEDQIQLISAIKRKAETLQASSFHSLFPCANSQSIFQGNSFAERSACQYHWFNRNYDSFDDFLSDLSSRKRKNIKKERSKCAAYDIQFYHGNEASEEDWKLFYAFYHRTYLKRSGRPGYLSESFFTELANTLGDQIILAMVEIEGKKVAGAVYFKDNETLYGRYWGTFNDIDGLHFETCYYKGIEYAIKHKLKRFDPGAQGEHKIQRGFQPVRTCSYHWLSDPRFQSAVGDFCEAEAKENISYIQHARSFLPFKDGHDLADIDAVSGAR